MPHPVSFTSRREAEGAHQPLHHLVAAAEVPVALGLGELLAGVEVQRHAVGANGLRQPLHPVHAQPHRLVQADVAQQRHRGRHLPHLEGRARLGVLRHGALAAHAEGQPMPLGQQRQVPVHHPGPLRATRHAR